MILQFQPVYQTRVWGGRELETTFRRDLPNTDQPFGESWEISAREEADSEVISDGPFQGKRLTELWAENRTEIFGKLAPNSKRFPLLCKILDARQRLSIQVHPPAEIASELGGEPKSETWFIADAEPGAEIYVGIREGVSRSDFETALRDGTVEDCVHRIPVSPGQHIFIPSGRLHAIGAGIVIYEIQQNSDTTFRVFDWNRVGLDGKPRDLHIEESLRCIDFSDIGPGMDSADRTLLCECDYFRMERHSISPESPLSTVTAGRFSIVTIISGELGAFGKGDFFLVAAGSDSVEELSGNANILATTWPTG
ncbi:MAG: class I mannose-6-phosphate isomerase [Verrucomicrobiales bacterium]|nr:class I mannose-6-phosphate isomerase [Verrucomicrobiales bacterium]